MENSEGLKEWEQIQSPGSQTHPTTTTAQWNDDTVVIKDDFFDEPSVFPPSHHEGLPVTPRDNQDLPEPSSSSMSMTSSASSSSLLLLCGEGSDGEGGAGPVSLRGEVGSSWRTRLGLLSSGFVRVAYMVRNYAVWRVGFWSITSAAAGVVAVVLVSLYVRLVQQRRTRVLVEDKHRLMIVIREKDQKINELLLQIAHMNETFSARRRVPVRRVG